jgi:hypothetical protein
MSAIQSAYPTLARQAATPAAGYTLVNGTGAVITWTAPSDGQNHRVQIFASLSVTSSETGGAIQCSYTAPDGTSTGHTVYGAGQTGPDVIVQGAPFSVVIKAGTAFTISQTSALTAGAAVLFAEIWGS